MGPDAPSASENTRDSVLAAMSRQRSPQFEPMVREDTGWRRSAFDRHLRQLKCRDAHRPYVSLARTSKPAPFKAAVPSTPTLAEVAGGHPMVASELGRQPSARYRRRRLATPPRRRTS